MDWRVANQRAMPMTWLANSTLVTGMANPPVRRASAVQELQV